MLLAMYSGVVSECFIGSSKIGFPTNRLKRDAIIKLVCSRLWEHDLSEKIKKEKEKKNLSFRTQATA